MINKKVILGAVVVAGLCLLYLFLLLNGLSYKREIASTPRANLVVMTAAVIPTADTGLLLLVPTATQNASIEINGISVGSYVKISGTEGVGLRIRRTPGTDTEVIFLANESELFIVAGGPQEQDGIWWWQLTTPYDDTRSGWASGDFLEFVENTN